MCSRSGPALFLALLCTASIACFDFGSVTGGVRPDAGGPMSGDDASAGAPADGGGADAGDGGGAFCASLSPPPTYCNDFDEAAALASWDQVIQQNGSVGADPLAAFSAPASLLTETSNAVSGQSTEADALKQLGQFQGQAIKISASFEMNVEQWDPSTSGQIIAFEIIFKNSPTTFNQIVLNLNSVGPSGVTAQIAENAQGLDGGEAGYNSYAFTDHPPTKAWTKVEVDLVVASPKGSASNAVTVTLDGKTELAQQALQVPLQGGVPWVHLGIGYVATPAQPWVVRYDNFALDVSTL